MFLVSFYLNISQSDYFGSNEEIELATQEHEHIELPGAKPLKLNHKTSLDVISPSKTNSPSPNSKSTVIEAITEEKEQEYPVSSNLDIVPNTAPVLGQKKSSTEKVPLFKDELSTSTSPTASKTAPALQTEMERVKNSCEQVKNSLIDSSF